MNDCTNFVSLKDKPVPEALVKHWNIIGYCTKLSSYVTAVVCQKCTGKQDKQKPEYKVKIRGIM